MQMNDRCHPEMIAAEYSHPEIKFLFADVERNVAECLIRPA